MSRIILIGGGSSSGKTYITEAVMKYFSPDEVTHITMDDYYRDQSDMPMAERYQVNYDHPKAFDWPLMRRQILALKQGQPIEKPIYDFVQLTRSGRTETIVPHQVVLVEGIMALVDRQVRHLGDLRVFIQARAERRFLRRIIRDSQERGRTFENIVHQYFSTVQPMYDEIVKPSSEYADLIINNDGVENLAIEVLRCLVQEELDLATGNVQEKQTMDEEFSEETLRSAFLAGKK